MPSKVCASGLAMPSKSMTVGERVLHYCPANYFVMSVDLATGKVNPNFAAADGVHAAMAVNKGAQVLITNGRSNSVAILDGKSGAVLATIPAGKNPDAATFDASTGRDTVVRMRFNCTPSCAWGGMGMEPHTPAPPALTLAISLSKAPL